MGCTLASPGEYDLNVHVRRRCGLMSNYFDHSLVLQCVELQLVTLVVAGSLNRIYAASTASRRG